MNGAMLDEEAKTKKVPKAANKKIIGINHQYFRSQKKEINSPKMENRAKIVFIVFFISLPK